MLFFLIKCKLVVSPRKKEAMCCLFRKNQTERVASPKTSSWFLICLISTQYIYLKHVTYEEPYFTQWRNAGGNKTLPQKKHLMGMYSLDLSFFVL